jgi:hypothetical protein
MDTVNVFLKRLREYFIETQGLSDNAKERFITAMMPTCDGYGNPIDESLDTTQKINKLFETLTAMIEQAIEDGETWLIKDILKDVTTAILKH